MIRVLIVALAAALATGAFLGGVVAVIDGTDGTATAVAASPHGEQLAVPASWELLDQQAAGTCGGLPWTVLAAIGWVESDSGQSSAPGVASGTNAAGAEGPMQFEPATFAAYATIGPGGATPPSPYDPVDAVYTAAAMLCADGGGVPATLADAVYDYNHSGAYVSTVLVLAQALASDNGLTETPAAAVAFAAAQIGTPYEWGGTGRGGFDCSGLTQAAYAAAGVDLPRTAQDQYDAGPSVPTGASVEPGDLLFFGTAPTDVSHVGLYVGAGEMVDAPHSGADVREEAADWGDLVGATRPG